MSLKAIKIKTLNYLITNIWVCLLLLFMLVIPFSVVSAVQPDPLPSWNSSMAKKSIIAFVNTVTDPKSTNYVKPVDRIAVFDNDGTLWVEQPIYTQISFVFDRVKQLAPQHPEWKTTQPFKALLEGDMKTVGASGMQGLMKMLIATHTGMSSSEFAKSAKAWLATTKHPRFKRLYIQLVYQPQLELLSYLRKNGFKTFIVSGGGIAFMRPWTKKIYGIPSEHVVGSSVITKFQIKNGKAIIMRMPKIAFINDKTGKPVGINIHIGKRPILAFGNADADMEMIQYTKAGKGLRLGLFVHHTDAKREYAYDRKSHVGKLDKVLDLAKEKGWIIIDMKRDWNQIFPEGQ